MVKERIQRRLAAILAADVVGYSHLMERDEAGTLAALKTRRKQVLEPLVASHHGRIFKSIGDGVLLEFGSAVDAVECAIHLQKAMATANSELPSDRRITLRIGINIGDVVVEGRDLYGDGVNIAARLEGLAEAGGICVSHGVYEQVIRKLDCNFDDLGLQSVKNMAQSIHVYRVRPRSVPISEGDRPAGEPLPLPAKPSIAVLPFTLISADEDSTYFAEGVADDIITEFSRNRDLFVAARHSSFHIAKQESDPAAIGRALGVRHLLAGSIRRAGERLRLSLHLIECASGSEAWAERYDRRLEDVFDVQLDVARTVTSTIAGRLTALAGDAIVTKAPENFAAYDHVLRAQQYLQHYTRADYACARQHLQAAIRADPSYARPYGLLCMAGVYDWFWEMSGDGLADVLKLGETALAMDDRDAKAHLALAVAYLFSWQHDRALHHIERAMALNPNDDLIATEHARLLVGLGRGEDGLLRIREAMRLNPYHPNWYWNIEGLCLHVAGRYEEAIDAYGRIEVPQFWVEAYLAGCHAMCGRDERAAHHRARLLAMRPDFRLSVFRRGLPIRGEASLRRFLETFRKAGLPD